MTESSDVPSDPPDSGYPVRPAFYEGYPPPFASPQNGLGTASLLIVIVALTTVWSVFDGVIFGSVAVAIGFAARGRVKRGEATNRGVTVTGIVLGIVSIVVGLIFIPVWAAIVIAGIRDDNYNNCMQKAGPNKYLQQIWVASGIRCK
jgi:hypothetical protein